MTEDDLPLVERLRGSPTATALVVMGGFCVVTMGVLTGAVGLLAAGLGVATGTVWALAGGVLVALVGAGWVWQRARTTDDASATGVDAP